MLRMAARRPSALTNTTIARAFQPQSRSSSAKYKAMTCANTPSPVLEGKFAQGRLGLSAAGVLLRHFTHVCLDLFPELNHCCDALAHSTCAVALAIISVRAWGLASVPVSQQPFRFFLIVWMSVHDVAVFGVRAAVLWLVPL